MEVAQDQKVEAAPQPDVFSLDENSLVSLSPEQRAGLEPIIDGWKKKANEEISNREKSAVEKYKPIEEKAQALDKLTQYQPFVDWWGEQQKRASQGATPQEKTAIQSTKPQDFASPQEWQDAIWEASQGNPQKLTEIQQRAMSAWSAPLVQQMTERQKTIETQIELKDLFDRHPDARDLDTIGLDSKTQNGVSLLEMALDWAERNQKPLEEGYRLAKTWKDSLSVSAQQAAMGMVNEKKASVTAVNSTAQNNNNIVEVENADELIKRSLEANLAGQTGVRFVIRGKK